MISIKYFFIFAIVAAISHGKVVNVKNAHSTTLVVTAGSAEYTVVSNGFVSLILTDEWSGTISAIPLAAEITNGPKTKVELSLSASGDSYSVSLVDGFNLGIKIIPNGSTSCGAAVCVANILKVCPAASQVTNSLGAVVACQNSPLVMSTLCPLAVVSDATSINVQSCADATSYLVIIT